nr:immunoglobulin light chain junction region [Macaca mulatta]MOV34409.1 immunoglobulin light chain junction region [Macaca mulatta]MOV35131.1 immunoglobulin light chain junction region [Macaca mulatta]MOV35153.1 immunoglobulin light chain junction region [Macaca mulatta]MOV35365.1 immunoglobulin light chain junction region [Macaca mulatta]
CYQYYSGYSF